MASADYVADLKAKLHTVDNNIERATKLLENGKLQDKAHALSEMAHLRQRHDELVERIEEAKAKGAEHWSDLHTSFQEEADALVDTLERWLTKLD